MSTNDIALSEVLDALRNELTTLNQKAADSANTTTFEVNDIEVELLAKVTQQDKAKGSAGVKFWVFNSTVSGERADGIENYQKIKLSLKPKFPNDNEEISDTVERMRGA